MLLDVVGTDELQVNILELETLQYTTPIPSNFCRSRVKDWVNYMTLSIMGMLAFK